MAAAALDGELVNIDHGFHAGRFHGSRPRSAGADAAAAAAGSAGTLPAEHLRASVSKFDPTEKNSTKKNERFFLQVVFQTSSSHSNGVVCVCVFIIIIIIIIIINIFLLNREHQVLGLNSL